MAISTDSGLKTFELKAAEADPRHSKRTAMAMFDPAKESFREWDAPTPHTYPYDVFVDRNGELWSGSMSSDRILRFDPASGKSVEYLLPRQTNVRRVFVDNRTRPVTFWVGSNHGASIIRLTPLDERLD